MKGENSKKICPNCGTTLDDFHRSGLLGCVTCYTVFREEVLSAVRYVQGGACHLGKQPTTEAGSKYQLAIERDQLYEGLAQAYRDGRFSDAEKMQQRLEEIARLLRPKEDVT